MNEIELIRAQVSTERSHMAAVKNACRAALESADRGMIGAEALRDFCAACADYLVLSVGRFNAQDAAHCEVLRPRLGADDAADRRTLEDLEHTLALSREALARLEATLRAYRQGSASAPQLVAACREYVRFFDGVLARRRHAIAHLYDRHYGVAEWRRVSFVDADSILAERSRFATVQGALPPGIALESRPQPG